MSQSGLQDAFGGLSLDPEAALEPDTNAADDSSDESENEESELTPEQHQAVEETLEFAIKQRRGRLACSMQSIWDMLKLMLHLTWEGHDVPQREKDETSIRAPGLVDSNEWHETFCKHFLRASLLVR
jgi:hypothetical protein